MGLSTQTNNRISYSSIPTFIPFLVLGNEPRDSHMWKVLKTHSTLSYFIFIWQIKTLSVGYSRILWYMYTLWNDWGISTAPWPYILITVLGSEHLKSTLDNFQVHNTLLLTVITCRTKREGRGSRQGGLWTLYTFLVGRVSKRTHRFILLFQLVGARLPRV